MYRFRVIFYLLLLIALLGMIIATGACDDDDDDDDDANADDDSGDDDDDDDDNDDDTPPPEPFDEAEANLGQWVWIDVEGSLCRGGSATGIGVRLQDGADKLVIFLQGGGACFDEESCGDTPDSYDATDLTAEMTGDLAAGVFNDVNTDNPLGDWNFVFVPYCTGDLHSGNLTDGGVPDVDGAQQFVGYGNVTNMLDLVAPYFADAAQVMLIGQSAGGFGSLLNYPQVAPAFPDHDVVLLDDSGPLPADNAVLSPLLQSAVRVLWNVVVPEDCVDCHDPSGDGIEHIQPYLAEQWPASVFGLFSTTEDEEIRGFFDLFGPISGPAYAAAMIDLRDNLLLPTGRWSTYFYDDTFHTFTTDDDRYFDLTVGDDLLIDWVAALAAGSVPAPVGP